jgi:hypothetical protein
MGRARPTCSTILQPSIKEARSIAHRAEGPGRDSPVGGGGVRDDARQRPAPPAERDI